MAVISNLHLFKQFIQAKLFTGYEKQTERFFDF